MKIKRFNESLFNKDINIIDIFQSTIDLIEEPFHFKDTTLLFPQIEFDLHIPNLNWYEKKDIDKLSYLYKLKGDIIADINHVLKRCDEVDNIKIDIMASGNENSIIITLNRK